MKPKVRLKAFINSSLVIFLLVQLVGCINSSSNADQNTDSKEELEGGSEAQVGDGYHGFLTLPEGWVDVPAPWLVEGTELPDDFDKSRDWFEYSSDELEASISVTVCMASGLEEELITMRFPGTQSPLEKPTENTITLDDGRINPVFRFFSRYSTSRVGEAFIYDYIFEGGDGLARRVKVVAPDEETILYAQSIVENTYTFNCEPLTMTRVSISGVERKVLLSQDGVEVTLLGYYELNDNKPRVALRIDNNRDEAIRIVIRNIDINGKLTDLTNSSNPGGFEANYTAVFGFPFDTAALEGVSETHIDNVAFCIEVIDVSSDERLFLTEPIVLTPVPVD